MGKRIPKPKRRMGRPCMNLKRFSVGLTQDDHDWLTAFGNNYLAHGIRKAINALRKGARKR